MKKWIKNYLTKLKENDKKGFSLVELIIVMAIMAILVGIVAGQVIPYMEKSRQSKDQQQISSVASSIVSAIAQDSTFDQSALTAATSFELKDLGTNTTSTIDSTFADLSGQSGNGASAVETAVLGKFKSKAGTAASTKIYVTLDPSGKVTVEAGTAAGSPASDKLKVETE